MKSKTKKTEELGLLKNKLPKFEIIVFTSFSKMGEKGLSVAQMTELKRLLRSSGSEYFVTKKTLMNLAMKDKSYNGLDVYGMDGSIGLVLGNDDSYRIAKSVYEFSRKNPALHFCGAIMDGKFIDTNAFMEIAKMPSREVIIGQLLGMLAYPMRRLAVVLSEVAKSRTAPSLK